MKSSFRRRAACLACGCTFVCSVLTGGLLRAAAPVRPIASYFRGEPSESLAHGLEVAPDDHPLPAGLETTRRYRWLPDLKLVVVEVAIHNLGKTSATLPRATVLDLAFPAEGDFAAPQYRPLDYRNAPWYGSTYWTGPDWTRVGKDWHHPGVNTPSVRRFTAPRDGRVTVSGRVYKAHLDGDGIRAIIRHGDRTVWQTEIDGADERGAAPKLSLDVRKGDAIRFIVHKRGRIECDTTRWDPIVAYDDGREFQASTAFDAHVQGGGGWSYEMQVSAEADRGAPRVRCFDPALAVEPHVLRAGQNVTVASDGRLPVVLARSDDRSGGVVVGLVSPKPWKLAASLAGDGACRLNWSVGDGKRPIVVPGGACVGLGSVIVGPYRGRWLAGVALLERIARSNTRDPAVAQWRETILASIRHATALPENAISPGGPDGGPMELPELDLWALVVSEWREEDKIEETSPSYAEATARHIKGAGRFSPICEPIGRRRSCRTTPAGSTSSRRLPGGTICRSPTVALSTIAFAD